MCNAVDVRLARTIVWAWRTGIRWRRRCHGAYTVSFAYILACVRKKMGALQTF